MQVPHVSAHELDAIQVQYRLPGSFRSIQCNEAMHERLSRNPTTHANGEDRPVACEHSAQVFLRAEVRQVAQKQGTRSIG